MRLQIRLFTSLCCLFLVGCTQQQVTCEVPAALSPIGGELHLHLLDSIPRKNDERGDAVYSLLETAGCDQLERQWVNARDGDNLICTVKGSIGNKHILIGAHYDTVPPSAGIADNWTGITMLVSLASHFSQHRPEHTLEFVAFSGEERDLQGARAYTFRKGAKPIAMINLDTIGLSPLVFDPRSDPMLGCFAESQGIPRGDLIRDLTGDWEIVARHGVPVLALHSIQRKHLKLLHTRRDKRSLVDEEELQRSYQQSLDIVRLLNQSGVLGTP